MPEPGSTLKFKNFNHSMRVPFVIYADFESFIKPMDTCQPDPEESYTNKYQRHVPSSFCFYVKCFDDTVYNSTPKMYTAKMDDIDVGKIFVDELIKEVKSIYNAFKFPKKMIYTEEEAEQFESSTNCHICGKELGNDRVRDHCHITGKFRGAAHNGCNINYKLPKFIPVVFHNLSGYDAHLFIKKLGLEDGKISCIPNNEEKYISFTKNVTVDKFKNKEGKEINVTRELRFIDSFRFMASSLDTLTKNLKPEQCKTLNKHFKGERRNLLLKKGIYPYEYMDSIKRLDETELPPKSAFYSKFELLWCDRRRV